MLTLGETCSNTSGSNRLVNHFGMTKSRNDLLCYENFTAYRTVSTLCKTCVGASRSYCSINYFGMTECGNDRHTTYLTNFRSRTCGRLPSVVPLCFNNGLRYEDFTANGAVLAFRKTCFGAGGFYSFIDYFGMT